MAYKVIKEKLILCYAVFILLIPSILKAEVLTIGDSTAQPGDTIILPITIDSPESIIGAVFTITYNNQYFTLIDIQSSFFDTFANQWTSIIPQPDPMPPIQVSVGGTVYSQPLLSRPINGGTMVAGIRAQAGETLAVLYTLEFKVGSNIPEGTYTINIESSYINDVNAGYSNGAYAPMLTSQIEGEEHPKYAYRPIYPFIVPGIVVIDKATEDSDGDGISDAWEIFNFGFLTTADETTDFDKDGYTDLQEFINQKNNENDPDGNPYDPKQKNAPYGTGYQDISKSNKKKFWTIMMPVLMGIQKQ